MPIPVVLDSFSWPSKKAAEADFRAILRESGYKVGDRITDPTHEQMLLELLERHPEAAEKTGPGVDHFFIGRTADGNHSFAVADDAIGIWIRRVDGSPEDFSYRTAIHSHTAKSDAKEAMRELVDARRLRYRDERFADGHPVYSDLSGDLFRSRDSAQVVYIDPTWPQLTYAFAMNEGGWDKMPVHSGHGATRIGSVLEDEAQAERWLEFHEAHANFGLATANEAARRPRSDEKPWTP
ncbi:DCL family protein [Leifsonia shinshuensis]|uniref:DUF3223 domain-containing protein n=1 Tax=Leifsonia shinshuensis TaxID=150026 RepID=A0A7G6YBJ9_9MICO|nr:DCL family protein [Leifsonia shinshuensis]QNE35864.1 DUF3223 domain-containing protein [Leifsonia shinshuensis]